MKKRIRIAAVGSVVSGFLAASCSTMPVPVVDMEGVDQIQYNRDLADRYDETPAFAFGNWLATCLESKGYTVLVGHDLRDTRR